MSTTRGSVRTLVSTLASAFMGRSDDEPEDLAAAVVAAGPDVAAHALDALLVSASALRWQPVIEACAAAAAVAARDRVDPLALPPGRLAYCLFRMCGSPELAGAALRSWLAVFAVAGELADDQDDPMSHQLTGWLEYGLRQSRSIETMLSAPALMLVRWSVYGGSSEALCAALDAEHGAGTSVALRAMAYDRSVTVAELVPSAATCRALTTDEAGLRALWHLVPDDVALDVVATCACRLSTSSQATVAVAARLALDGYDGPLLALLDDADLLS